MNILIACEESQAICKAMRAKGHNAFSCDILPCSGGHPEWHIQGNCLDIISPPASLDRKWARFITQDNKDHKWAPWDMIIGHPPCTFLSNAGAVWMFPGKKLNQERYEKMIKARDFFMKLWNAPCDKVCVENPLPLKIAKLPPHTQVIQPFMFGAPYKKRTLLWLKGLPKLQPTKIITEGLTNWICVNSNRGDAAKAATFRDSKTRSKTFPEIADAMAEQWA